MGEARRTVVLVVEPDPVLAETMCEVLGISGYRCLRAASAEEALTTVRAEGATLDIVAVDVARHLDGTEPLLDALATFRGGVFVLSAVRSDERLASARGLPFLAMPFDLDDFEAHVARQLDEPTRPSRLPRF